MNSNEEALYSIFEKAKKYDDLAFLSKNKLINCSFCGKDESNLKKLIAGPDVFICNECIEICVEILEEDANKKKS